MRLVSGLLFAGAAAILFLGCGSTEEVSETDLPSATLTPTTSESPSTNGSSTITVRFVNDGQPVNVILGTAVNRITADGKNCGPGGVLVYIARSAPGFVTTWPMREDLVTAECTKEPPTELEFRFQHELGPFIATVHWQGDDVSVDVEVPEAAVVEPDA